jgi:hypothetical protein
LEKGKKSRASARIQILLIISDKNGREVTRETSPNKSDRFVNLKEKESYFI